MLFRCINSVHNSSMIYGYARVSTEAQDLTDQLQKLTAAGCEKIFHEKRSGKSRDDRPQLAKLLKALQPGDTVLATVTDRVARDPLDMLNIMTEIRAKGAGLRLLEEPFIDTTSEMADLVVFLVGWAARWQRRRILENTASGRELAKSRGVKFGRKPKLTPHQQQEARQRIAAGELTREVARSYNVSHSTISRLPKLPLQEDAV